MSDSSPAPAPRARGIYLLPNLLTTGGLFSGFYAILAAADGRFEIACIAVFVAGLFDSLDGRIARYTGTTSEFGVQYDSLADLVSFGKIGRASCRERVWQYVWVSVVGVSLKKKKEKRRLRTINHT